MNFTSTRQYHSVRPGYPPEIVSGALEYVAPAGLVADIGAGTGKLSEALALAGFRPVPLEPNSEMRLAFSIARVPEPRPGSAEATGLSSASVSAVVCGQAIHYFDVPASIDEFARISPRGHLVSFLNVPAPDSVLIRLTEGLGEGKTIDLVAVIEKYSRVLGAPREFAATHRATLYPEDVFRLVFSLSDFASLSDIERRSTMLELRRRARLLHRGRDLVQLEYVCIAHRWRLPPAQ